MTGSREALLTSIRRDPIAADFLWSIFVAALHSYRHDTVLRPFPPFYVNRDNGEKNVEHLKSVVKDVRSLKEMSDGGAIHRLSEECVQLLAWVLQTRHFTLKSHHASKFEDIKQLTKQCVGASVPTYVLEVIYEPESETRFGSVLSHYDLIYAYHGSSMENFYSILSNGLCNHMNKNSVFGEGTYLSSELGVSLIYSPTGTGWTHSLIGEMLGCVAVCEIVNHPTVKSQTKELKRGRLSLRKKSSVPEKYFIVQNDELVRVKYLLVYPEKTASRRFSSVSDWASKHSFALTMICYVLILICIGLKNVNIHQKLNMFI